jgi:hypothetical protein
MLTSSQMTTPNAHASAIIRPVDKISVVIWVEDNITIVITNNMTG